MKGVPFANVTYMKVVPFLSKMVYIDGQGVRLQGGASPYKNVVKYPFPVPPGHGPIVQSRMRINLIKFDFKSEIMLTKKIPQPVNYFYQKLMFRHSKMTNLIMNRKTFRNLG